MPSAVLPQPGSIARHHPLGTSTGALVELRSDWEGRRRWRPMARSTARDRRCVGRLCAGQALGRELEAGLLALLFETPLVVLVWEYGLF